MHSWAPRSAARQANLAIVLFRPPSSAHLPKPQESRWLLCSPLPMSPWVSGCPSNAWLQASPTVIKPINPPAILPFLFACSKKHPLRNKHHLVEFCPDDSVCNWFPYNTVVFNRHIGVHSTGHSMVQRVHWYDLQGYVSIFGGRGIKMIYK